jgi:hypothetical protein
MLARRLRHQLREVEHRARQPVELRDNQRRGIAALKRAQSLLDTGPTRR